MVDVNLEGVWRLATAAVPALLDRPPRGEAGALEAAMSNERLLRVSRIVHRFAEDVRGDPRRDREERMVLRGALLPPLF